MKVAVYTPMFNRLRGTLQATTQGIVSEALTRDDIGSISRLQAGSWRKSHETDAEYLAALPERLEWQVKAIPDDEPLDKVWKGFDLEPQPVA